MSDSYLPTARRGARPLRLTSGLLLRRMRCLRLEDADVVACRTVGDLQIIAKLRYRHLAQFYHPDSNERNTQAAKVKHGGQAYGGRPLTGSTFRLITAAYKWVRKLDPTLLLSNLPMHTRTAMPVQEGILPDYFDRKTPELPEGWSMTWL